MSDDVMPRIGISVSSTHKEDGPRRMIERTRAAHHAGLTSLTVGDHHNMAVPYAQNTPMLGRLLAEWPDRPAGCLFLVPLWSPLLMAEQIGTLAAAHQIDAPGEPFIVQTGIGYGEEQLANFGTTMSERGRYIDAALPVVRALLAGETVDEPYFGLRGAKVGLRSSGSYEWWVGGGADAAIDRAARFGAAWYASPGMDDDTIRRGAERFRAGGGTRVVLRRDTLMRLDGNRARADAAELVAKGYRGLRVEQLLTGSPDEVAERARQLAALGVDDIIVRCAATDQSSALETLSALGVTNS